MKTDLAYLQRALWQEWYNARWNWDWIELVWEHQSLAGGWKTFVILRV